MICYMNTCDLSLHGPYRADDETTYKIITIN